MSDLSLEAVLDWFTRISQVPRTSGDEERLSTQLLEHARARGLQAEQDTADSPKTATFYFYNTFLSDPSEYHVFYIIALGTGTVNLSVGPAAVADVSYAAAGLLGIKPVFGVGLYATPIVMTARAAFFSFGAIFMASHRAEPVLGVDYPVPMLMEAYFTDTAATTTTTTAAETTTTTTAAAS